MIANADYFEVHELKIRTVTDDYFVGVDKEGTRQAYLFYFNDINRIIFTDRKEAVKKINELRKVYRNTER